MLGEVKYLGVILDSKLNWKQHLQKIIRKVQTDFEVVSCMYGIKWGLRPNMVHWLYIRVIRPSICHAALVWWPTVMQKTTKIQLGRIQRMACLVIIGTMKLTPTAAMEVLSNVTLLYLLIMAEARMALDRLHILKQLTTPNTVSVLLTIWRNVGDPLLEMQSDYTIPVYHSKIFSVIIDWDYWRNKDPVFPENTLIWFTDCSRADTGIGSGIFGIRSNRNFIFPLGKYAMVFQTKMYAILQPACENIRRACKHKLMLIFSDSQVTLKALSRPKVTSGLVAECLDALSALASLNEVTLMWVPRHCDIPGNEEADKLARQASGMPLLGLQLAHGTPRCSACDAIEDWTQSQHYIA
jgi:hypothetical protein